MKSFIVLCSTIMLGLALYSMIMGPGDDSVMNILKEVWKVGVTLRTNTP